MKIALYIEDGLEQIVLTPESDTEKSLLEKLQDGSRELSIRTGSFWEVRGGYIRHEPHWRSIYGNTSSDHSTMIVLRPKKAVANDEVADDECPEMLA